MSTRRRSPRLSLVQLVKFAVSAHLIAQGSFILYKLLNSDPNVTLKIRQNAAAPGVTYSNTTKTETYSRTLKIEDGIEWISYVPHEPRHETPILMQHGMWHGAWCWETWQILLAEAGWESHAISQPGHGRSPTQRPIFACTLDYYLSFIRDAVNKLPTKPILMGHSMGGALTQWYIRYIGDLPGAVLVAPWALHDGFIDSASAFVKLDPVGCVLSSLRWKADFVRTPEVAAAALLSPDSIYTPEQLYARLNDESALVMIQHAFWQTPEHHTPMLWLAGEKDAVCPEPAERRSAAAYGAEYVVIPNAAHNLMMEKNYAEIAERIITWLDALDVE